MNEDLVLLYLIRWDAALLILAEHPEGLLVTSLHVQVLGQVLHDVAKLLDDLWLEICFAVDIFLQLIFMQILIYFHPNIGYQYCILLKF